MKALPVLVIFICMLLAYKVTLEEPVSTEDKEAKMRAQLEQYEGVMNQVAGTVKKYKKKNPNNEEIKALLASIENDPYDSQLYLDLGGEYYDVGAYSRATRAWKKALELGTEPSDVYEMREYISSFIGTDEFDLDNLGK